MRKLLLLILFLGTQMNTVAHTLLEATLTLYQADPSGAPITSNPIWLGVQADYVQIADHWLKVETRPTGAKFPKRHPLVPQYEISMARVWALSIRDLIGFRPVRSKYVLDVVWTDEDTGDWHRETFYGVTIAERSRGSRELDSHAGEFTENQVFDAQEMVPTSGIGTPPGVNADLPFTVRYVDTNGQVTNIYTYDPTTSVFTAVGDPSALAVLTRDSSSFNITFAGSSSPELTITASGVSATEFEEQAPTPDVVPRVDFYYGTNRVASVDRYGDVFAQSYFEGVVDPGNRPGVFKILPTGASPALMGTMEQGRIAAASFTAFVPDSIAGLKLWVDIKSLAAAADGTAVARWPDLSGHGNDLVQANPTNQPVLSRKTADAATGIPLDGLPGVLFDPTNPQFLATAGNVLATRQFSVFVLMWAKDLAAGYGIVSTMPNGTDETNYDFMLFDDVVFPGRNHFLAANYVAFDGVDNWITPSSGNPNPPQQWSIVELELDATGSRPLFGTVNGHEVFNMPISGATATTAGDDDKPIVLGGSRTSGRGARGGFGGYIRALLVYDTPPSAADKDKIRKYLSFLYRNNPTGTTSGRDVITP